MYVWLLGRPFLAQIAQNYSFWGQKLCFLPNIKFLETSSKKIFTIMPEHQKYNIFVLPRDSLGYGDSFLMLEIGEVSRSPENEGIWL